MPVPLLPIIGAATGVLVLVGAALGSNTAIAADPTPPRPLNLTVHPDWQRRVLLRVSGSEGGFSSQNQSWDGAGLSYGILQWTQKHGNLGILLRALNRADSAAFQRIFGPESEELLAVTNASTEAERLSLPLWESPWTARFTAAGKHPAFQQAQTRLALTGDHWKGAVKAATALGSPDLITERSMALFFDTSVQQGPSDAPRIAAEVRSALTAAGAVRVDYGAVLAAYAQTAANRARRFQATKPTERGSWREVSPGEWHKVIGKNYDYYADYHKRRFGIVHDPSLSDAPLHLSNT